MTRDTLRKNLETAGAIVKFMEQDSACVVIPHGDEFDRERDPFTVTFTVSGNEVVIAQWASAQDYTRQTLPDFITACKRTSFGGFYATFDSPTAQIAIDREQWLTLVRLISEYAEN